MDSYDVRKYEAEALNLLDRLFKNKQVVLMTGGTGLFASAIANGLDAIPDVSPEIRVELIQEFEEKGLDWLQRSVELADPEFYAQVDRSNPQRLMRALEIWRGTGLKFSSFRIKNKVHRQELSQRIDQRMELMLRGGLFKEAEGLFKSRNLNALQTLGYTEVFGFLEGKYDEKEMIRLLKRNSRRYAKRQLTWFRKDALIRWFHPDQELEILGYLNDQIALNLPNAATQL